eukprot:543413-Pelagomonas_calceolata.AAC.1
MRITEVIRSSKHHRGHCHPSATSWVLCISSFGLNRSRRRSQCRGRKAGAHESIGCWWKRPQNIEEKKKACSLSPAWSREV